jgi:hypothetical protein
MTVGDKNTETILSVLAEYIRDQKTEIFLKDIENERLKERVAGLEKKLKEANDGKN